MRPRSPSRTHAEDCRTHDFATTGGRGWGRDYTFRPVEGTGGKTLTGSGWLTPLPAPGDIFFFRSGNLISRYVAIEIESCMDPEDMYHAIWVHLPRSPFEKSGEVALPVEAARADRASGATDQRQDQTYHGQDDAEGHQDADPEQEAEDQEHYTKNDHGRILPSGVSRLSVSVRRVIELPHPLLLRLKRL